MRRTIAAAVLAALCSACGATPWVQARGAVGAAGALVDVADGDAVRGLVPEEHREELDTVVASGRELVDLGGSIVDAWQAAREEPRRWGWWADKALRWGAAVLQVIKNCGVDVPPALELAVGGLQLGLPLLAGALGG